MREALSRLLSVGEFRKLRRNLVPLAQARGIDTDEDVFRALHEREDRPRFLVPRGGATPMGAA